MKDKKIENNIIANIDGPNRCNLLEKNIKNEYFFLKKIRVIKYPEITKNRSTPRKPLGKILG